MAAMPADDIENMPDVIQLYSESVNLIRDYKRTVWTEDMLTTEGTMKKEDLMPGAVEEYSIGGRMIGMPWTVSALLLYYNQDYLDQAGVAVPATIAEMADALPVLVEKTGAEYGLNVRVNQYELENWIETQGRPAVNSEITKWTRRLYDRAFLRIQRYAGQVFNGVGKGCKQRRLQAI